VGAMVWRSVGCVVLGIAMASHAMAAGALRSARLDEKRTAILDSQQEIHLLVRPHKGDAWTRLSLRYTGEAAHWKEIAAANQLGDNLMTDRNVRIPFAMLKPSLQREAIQGLFPDDRIAESGWLHKVVLTGTLEGESYWKIAEWFTGDGANYQAIRQVNSSSRLSTRPGEIVTIPRKLLSPALQRLSPESVSEGKREEVAEVEDDPQQSEEQAPAPTVSASTVSAPTKTVAASDYSLEYERSAERPYAIYRLRKGEALYSSVAIRFTGRIYANDVNDVVEEIVKFNGIEDVARMHVDQKVKIPMELLAAEFRPLNDPRRLERDQAKRESARVAKKVGAKDLDGVRVIIDAGHGGRDVGTSHDGIWESVYVYDIAVRLKKTIEQNSAAKVSMTTRSKSQGYVPLAKNELPRENDHVVLTTPGYRLDDPTIGVNLRWYLANSIFRKAVKANVEEEKIIFLSIHADSLHPSLRGAMAYIPGERWARGKFEKSGSVYLARSEVRESPRVSISKEDALEAEGLSMRLAESIIGTFEKKKLEVHPFQPIRDNVVRDGREWVPAVIRYNKVPTRVLLEVCNLGNADDRKLIKTTKYRQKVADAIAAGIENYFAGESKPSGEGLTRTAAR
jgi:N-acetylmuramoyl-L-alanine amidase